MHDTAVHVFCFENRMRLYAFEYVSIQTADRRILLFLLWFLFVRSAFDISTECKILFSSIRSIECGPRFCCCQRCFIYRHNIMRIDDLKQVNVVCLVDMDSKVKSNRQKYTAF